MPMKNPAVTAWHFSVTTNGTHISVDMTAHVCEGNCWSLPLEISLPGSFRDIWSSVIDIRTIALERPKAWALSDTVHVNVCSAYHSFINEPPRKPWLFVWGFSQCEIFVKKSSYWHSVYCAVSYILMKPFLLMEKKKWTFSLSVALIISYRCPVNSPVWLNFYCSPFISGRKRMPLLLWVSKCHLVIVIFFAF